MTTRERHESLFAAIKRGDEGAVWKLFEDVEGLILHSARKIAGRDALLLEEFEAETLTVFERAFATYKPEKTRRMSWSDWIFRYSGMHFSRILRAREAEWLTEDFGDQADQSSQGAKDGDALYSGVELVNDEELPQLEDEVATELARLLAEGFKPREARAMLGLTTTEYRTKIGAIQKLLKEEGKVH
jgi:hypothetical protein